MLRRILNLAPEGAVAAAPPATPAPVAATPPPSAPKKVDGDPFAGIEEELAVKPTPPATPPEDKKVPDDKAPPIDPKAPQDRQIVGPKQLREAHERTQKENRELSKKISDYETKIADYETKGKDSSKLTERLVSLEKERDSLQADVRALRQEASPEFRQKYEKPFNDAAEFAKRTVESLEIKETDSAGLEKFRQATWQDFAALYSMPLNKASKAARQFFGDDAQTVINHLNELQRLDFTKSKALEEERASAKDREAKQVADRSKQTEAIDQMWRAATKGMEESDPELFQADPKDTKRAQLLTKGLQIWDSAQNPEKSGLTLQQKIVADAALRYRAASQPVLKYDLARAKERIIELEAKLKANGDADPETVLNHAGGGGNGKPQNKLFSEDLDELEKHLA